MKKVIRILDKNIEKSACLRRLKPFFESLLALLGANSPSAKFAKGLRIPRTSKKNYRGYKRKTGTIEDITMGPLPHWYGITIVFKVLVEE